MRINETNSKVIVALEGPNEAVSLPWLIDNSLKAGYTKRRWEITRAFPDEGWSYYVCIDFYLDEWCFYAIDDNGYTPDFSKVYGSRINTPLVGALCRLLTGSSCRIMTQMRDTRIFVEGA